MSKNTKKTPAAQIELNGLQLVGTLHTISEGRIVFSTYAGKANDAVYVIGPAELVLPKAKAKKLLRLSKQQAKDAPNMTA